MKLKVNQKAILGIIGGSGPQAGMHLMESVLSINKETMGDLYCSDKDAVSIILMQNPNVGGPHGSWDLEEPNSEPYKHLWENIISTIKKIDAMNAVYFCITCNTLHCLEALIRDWMKKENIGTIFVSIIEATKTEIIRHYNKQVLENGALPNFNHNNINSSASVSTLVKKNRVTILGTLLTTDIDGHSPYKGLFEGTDNELDCILLDEEARSRLQFIISETKRCGVTLTLQDRFFSFLNEYFLEDTGTRTDYIVLGCTELPLLLTEENKAIVENVGIVIIDPNRSLAKEMLRCGGYTT